MELNNQSFYIWCTGTHKEDNPQLADGFDETINQEEADESEDNSDGYNDDDDAQKDQDAMMMGLDLATNKLPGR